MILKPSSKSDTFIRKNIFPLFLFITASFIIYLPVLNHFFVSDDFKVLYRVCVERTLFIKKFFRPLSDLTIYLNYITGGLDPAVFNSFNILIHGINGWLLYVLCGLFGENQDKRKSFYFALISSVFFICYPFHNEAVVWMLGRGASMACLFALCGWIGFYKIKSENLKIAVTCGCYFISLTAFESTIIFPFVIFLLLIHENRSIRLKVRWALAFAATLCLHIMARICISGSILGSYGSDFFHSGLKIYFLNIAKTGGRLILPPSHHAALLSVLFGFCVIIPAFYIGKNFNRIKRSRDWKKAGVLIAMLCVTCVVPVVTGISTQTSETDRMLYFPSVFICMAAAFGIVFLIKNPVLKILIVLFIVSYNLIFLEINNLNWKKASSVTYSVVEKINEKKRLKIDGRNFFLNIPNEIEGAFVFRLGFQEAVKLYGLDSSRNIAVNYLSRERLEKIKGNKIFNINAAEIFLAPDIMLGQDSAGCRLIFDQGLLKAACRPDDDLYYWDYNSFVKIPGCNNKTGDR